MKTEVREFCGKPAENGEICGPSAGQEAGKAPACEPLCTGGISRATGTADPIRADVDVDLAPACAPCPCAELREDLAEATRDGQYTMLAAKGLQDENDSLRARFQESSDEYRKGLDALRAENDSLRAELAAEKERADSNYASCERVKQKFEDAWNESKRLRARVETLEADKARLDWLEKSLKARSWRFASWLCRGEYAAPEVVSAPVGDKWPEGVTQATARAAIDAARGALKEGK